MAVKNPRFQRFSAQALLWTLDAALKVVSLAGAPAAEEIVKATY
jgi:hypothetical protein